MKKILIIDEDATRWCFNGKGHDVEPGEIVEIEDDRESAHFLKRHTKGSLPAGVDVTDGDVERALLSVGIDPAGFELDEAQELDADEADELRKTVEEAKAANEADMKAKAAKAAKAEARAAKAKAAAEAKATKAE